MRVLIAMMPGWSGYICSLELAAGLSRRGHRVGFIGLNEAQDSRAPTYAAYLRGHGFDYLPLPLLVPPRARRFRRIRAARWVTLEILRSCGELLATDKTDLLIVDRMVSGVAIAGARQGVATRLLATTLVGPANSLIPPYTSDDRPGPKGFSSLRVRWRWLAHWWQLRKNQLERRIASLAAEQVVRWLARPLGLPCRFTEVGWQIVLPDDLHGVPAQFDFMPVPGRRYIGALHHAGRNEEPAEWLRRLVSRGRPIVYCSIGTGAALYPVPYSRARAFLATVHQAFRSRPDLSLVLNTGDLDVSTLLEASPENIEVRPWVPQLSVLDASACMITHGGIGAIKECITARVPMLVFPIAFDQPGNAVRVVHHDIGVRGDMATITGADLLRLVDDVLSRRAAFVKSLDEMRVAFLDPQPLEDAIIDLENAAHPRA